MKLAKYSAWLLIVLISSAVGYFMYKLSGRGLPADWVRPFISTFLAFWAVILLVKIKRYKLSLLAHLVIGYSISLFITLGYLYYRSIGAVFTGDDVVAIAQSNPEEIYDFFSHYIFNGLNVAATLGLLLLYMVVWGLIMQGFSASSPIRTPYSSRYRACRQRRSLIIGLVSILFLTGTVVITSQLRPMKYYRLMVNDLETKIARFHELVQNLENSSVNTGTKEQKGELYVLIIGESLSRDSMGVYTNSVDNTPYMSQQVASGKAMIYPNAYASFVNTVPSVTASFSQGNLKTGLTFPEGDNLISLAKKAGINTYWISNQVQNGNADTPIGAISSLADHTFFTTHFVFDGSYSQQPDMILIPELERTFASLNPEENNLVIIHVMGNHSPYYNRFPDDYPIVKLDKASQIGGLINRYPFNARLVEASPYENYLTAIKYNDMVMSKIGAMLAHRKDFQALVYYSDHGEALIYQSFNDISEDNAAQPAGRHNVAQFSYAMTRIPLYLEISDNYRQRYPEAAAALKANQEKIFTNDALYDFMLDLMQVKSNAVNYALSPANASYDRGSPDTVELLNHKIVGHDPDYLAFTHAHQDFSSSLVVKSANSTFKANAALAKGYQNLNLNTLWHKDQLYVRAVADFDSSFFPLKDFLGQLKAQSGAAAKLMVVLDNENELVAGGAAAVRKLLERLKELPEQEQQRIYFLVANESLLHTLLADSAIKLHLGRIFKDTETLTSSIAAARTEVATMAAATAEGADAADNGAAAAPALQDQMWAFDSTVLKQMDAAVCQALSALQGQGLMLLRFAPELSVQDRDFISVFKGQQQEIRTDFTVLNYYNAFDSDF